MEARTADQLETAASAIRRYLGKCPDASETAEGVTRWWLSRQRFNDSLELVQKALDQLESRGEVERIRNIDGRVLYRRSRD